MIVGGSISLGNYKNPALDISVLTAQDSLCSSSLLLPNITVYFSFGCLLGHLLYFFKCHNTYTADSFIKFRCYMMGSVLGPGEYRGKQNRCHSAITELSVRGA